MVRSLDYYKQLYDSMQVTRNLEVEHEARKLILYRDRYEQVEKETGVPWYVIGVIHMRESDFDFNTHLHNGDPLSGRTRHVPRGRPKEGSPPFTWEFSAKDALEYEGFAHLDNPWDIPFCLQELEKYNGLGYAQRGVPSPYIWAGSNQYHSGKFTSDGVYSSSFVDPQLGVAPVMQRVLSITGADAVPGSRGQLVATVGKWTGLGGMTFAGIVSQVTEWLHDWHTLVALGVVLAGATAAFWYLEKDRLRAYTQGRYIPSGEVNNAVQSS